MKRGFCKVRGWSLPSIFWQQSWCFWVRQDNKGVLWIHSCSPVAVRGHRELCVDPHMPLSLYVFTVFRLNVSQRSEMMVTVSGGARWTGSFDLLWPPFRFIHMMRVLTYWLGRLCGSCHWWGWGCVVDVAAEGPVCWATALSLCTWRARSRSLCVAHSLHRELCSFFPVEFVFTHHNCCTKSSTCPFSWTCLLMMQLREIPGAWRGLIRWAAAKSGSTVWYTHSV